MTRIDSTTADDQGTAGSPFYVIGAAEMRKDLALRHELKYDLTGADIGKLRSLLATNLRRVSFNNDYSLVSSLYFDDFELSSCRANIDGLANRRKLRLRWYDSDLPHNEFFLEVKWRRNRDTGKHRLQIGSDLNVSEIPFRTLRSELARVVPDSFAAELWRLSEPVMIVRYRREHYVSGSDATRVTLDTDLEFIDHSGRRAFSRHFMRRKFTEFSVLEGKVTPGENRRLRRLLHPFAPRVASSSKYVHGCRALGLVMQQDL